MKRMLKLSLSLSMMLLLFAIPSIVIAESNTEWKIWTPQTEVDIDKEWVIQFNDRVDWRSLSRENISVVRERDRKLMSVDPVTLIDDEQSMVLHLGHLYDFNETYHLYIKGVRSVNSSALKEPVKMEFKTINPEFNIEHTIEKDGVKFNVLLSQTDTKIYAKLKATNVSGKPINYTGFSGCDLGLHAQLFHQTDVGEVKVGSQWRTAYACTEAIEQYVFKPGETIEKLEVLSSDVLDREVYLRVELQTGAYDNYNPIEIEIPIKQK